MMLTSKGRYAVMAMVDLAMHGKDGTVTLSDIAGRQEITQAYLEQIFAKLKRCGLVKSVRGPGGGYLLGKLAHEISVAEIILSQDEKIKMTRCEEHNHGGCMSDKSRCVTHDLWDGLSKNIRNYLGSISLADVCERQMELRSFKPEMRAVR